VAKINFGWIKQDVRIGKKVIFAALTDYYFYMSKIRFSSNPSFFHELRKRVDSYFKDQDISKTGDFRLYSKTIILLSSLLILYIWLVWFTPAIWVALILCGLMGVNMAAIGFNVMHDGAHGSYSSNPNINAVMGFALNVMGGNVYIWKLKHNINHHTFTNIEGHDDDIDIKPFLRIHEEQEKRWHHRFQHIYSVFLYGLTYIFWIYFNDFNKYFSGKVSEHTTLKKMDVKQHISFWASKVVYTFAFIVWPGMQLGWTSAIVGYLLMAGVTGIFIAIVFQLAHVVEDTEFVAPNKDEIKQLENEWAVHQLKTTVNFATGNRFLNWLLGGLNFQVEHHLFPSISHIHYPELNKIVRQACEEFNMPYKEYSGFFAAIQSHFSHLKQIGKA